MDNIEQIKQLREETGVSISECKKALENSSGDIEKAKEILRKWGKELAGKKIERNVNQGAITSYIHPNKKIGVLMEIRCESDFVAKSEDFQKLSHEICLQIAAAYPLFISEDDIPEEFIEKEKNIYKDQLNDLKKPENIANQIIDGKLLKYKKQISLLSQPWIKDETKTIKDLLNDYIGKLGENIVIRKFTRYEI